MDKSSIDPCGDLLVAGIEPNRWAGFETKQVLVVASELISNLNDALKKTRAKTEG